MLGWYKINGGLKDMSCRVAMLRMERQGLIQLPPSTKKNVGGGAANICKRTKATEPQPIFTYPIQDLGPIRLELVNKTNSLLWNEYIDRYHYLGHKKLPSAEQQKQEAERREKEAERREKEAQRQKEAAERREKETEVKMCDAVREAAREAETERSEKERLLALLRKAGIDYDKGQ